MLNFSFFFFVLLFFFMFNNWWFFLLFMLFFYPFFFTFNFDVSFLSKNSYMCLDNFSFCMVILTFWIVFLSVFSSVYLIYDYYSFNFLLVFWMLMLFLFFFFVVSNFFFFFFFFESTLFPTFFLILGWGNNYERMFSGFYLFFYTLFSSMPMLFSIFYVLNLNNSGVFMFLDLSFGCLNLVYFFLVISFLVKIPMFLVHSWLPKAHVEAPVSGSMILAGVLLKMGGYGIFRLSFLLKYFFSFSLVWIYISIWGGLVSSFICLRQVDLKSLIAFSSVSHMSLVIIGLMIFFDLGVIGSLMLMISHGLCSSGMFYLANVIYERSGTRSIFLNKGLMSIFPSLSLWWFILCSFNMAAPPSLNLISEIFLFSASVSWNYLSVFFLMLFSFIGGAYNLFLFTFLNHGKVFSNLNFFNPCYIREYLVLFLHVFPISFLFLSLELFY
uniref:NADH dehydrogenase subunit 4 n=1 Tax=Odontothrips phaseoli TaxID=3078581 RepID=UPI002A8404B9|nr:NADH dehydrogenase subunit 4 [Odontothrips phaseoli]WOH21585.1 NADH dehydrogenase subunit 4 [Odontothrips phaseoli]